jgi:hypothetical protein
MAEQISSLAQERDVEVGISLRGQMQDAYYFPFPATEAAATK